MSAKNYDIEIPKLDYYVLSIGIKNKTTSEFIQLGANDLMFMTVSLEAGSDDYKFQKSLGDGITYNSETGKYDIVINSSDTADLEYGVEYGYDIVIYYDGNKPKQIVVGLLKIGKKFTVNEVS